MTQATTREKRKRRDREATKRRRGRRKGDETRTTEQPPEPWERPTFRERMIRKGGRP